MGRERGGREADKQGGRKRGKKGRREGKRKRRRAEGRDVYLFEGCLLKAEQET